MLFDSDNEHTYILITLVDAIESETIRTEYLGVGMFGASTTEYLSRDVVSITVSDRTDQEIIQTDCCRENMQPYTVT